AHLKLDLILKETGFRRENNERFRVFLTNSLEEGSRDVVDLFMSRWLTDEAKQANSIKRDTPVMCVIGNPPYAVSSSNKGTWIQNLIVDYKKDLNERNIQPLSDDYIKFIRFGQHFIDKNGSGVLAYISNNSFIDGIIHRQMRKKILEDFDTVYILNLHGNSKKNEVSPDGSKDENVFDIQQGVSINIFVKTGKKKVKQLAKVLHYDLFGKRRYKYDFLNQNNLQTLEWKTLKREAPYFFFVPKDFKEIKKYEIGFSVNEVFKLYNVGTATGKDSLYVAYNAKMLQQKLETANLAFKEENLKDYNYRIFDKQKILYDNTLIQRLRLTLQENFNFENIGLVTTKILSSVAFYHAFLTTEISDRCFISNKGQEANYVFPLYLYPENNKQQSTNSQYELNEQQLLELRKEELLTLLESSKQFEKMYASVKNPDESIKNLYKKQSKNFQSLKKELVEVEAKLATYKTKKTVTAKLFTQQERTPNLNKKIIVQIEQNLGIAFENEKTGATDKFAPIDILDYIYAVLHSPTYREKYKEFLKIDFPRVPYPKDQKKFWQLVALGSELRQIHLLESSKVEQFITQYPVSGDNVVDKPKYEKGKVYINETQYFDNVPVVAWEFYIGGYQPAQKWLKDRKGRKLEFEEILHYQKIIVALSETDRLMTEIDKIEVI
ncbi:MAG: DNA methyltransferase, partial [Bernardetiaceae bacterium]|nr:DNA methyltransferase [Bernardetiaceae bacterium]